MNKMSKNVDQDTSITITMRPIAFSLFLALGTVALVAHAGIVADGSAPSNQQPVVLNAANGVPQVNIQTPSAAGVSRNTYTQFDVQQQGVILNNSRTDVQTQLGGYVQANPYLATGAARVILNEVNSNNPSLLQGYIEVAGSRAQVVIANPAGVTCDGCGFINANRATLTTGTPILNGGSLDGYRIQRGTISITGNGLDASQTDYTDIIARAVQVNASIYANDLRVTAGSNQVNTANTTATAIAGTGTTPSLAIDVAQLGGMYAGKIQLIGTEAGVGVSNAGQIGASAGDVVVSASGFVQAATGTISSSGNTSITTGADGFTNSGTVYAIGNLSNTSTGDLINSGTLYAQGNNTLTTIGNITNTAMIAALGNTSLTANGTNSQISSNTNSILAAGLKADGTFFGTGNLSLSATKAILANGQNLAIGNATFSGSRLDLSNSQTNANDLTLTASAGNIDASGATLTANGTLGVTANTNNNQVLITDNASVTANQFSLGISNLSNVQGELVQFGTGDSTIAALSAGNTLGYLDNTGGWIASNGQNLILSADALTNTSGSIEHAGTADLVINANSLTGDHGQILSNGNLNLTVIGSANLDHANTTANQVSITAGSLSNISGQIIQSGSSDTVIQVTTAINNTSGTIAGNGNLTLSGGSINNANGILQAASGNDLTVSSTGDLTNTNGQITADRDFSLTVNTLLGNGSASAGRDATIGLQGNYILSSGNQLSANRNLTLTLTGAFTNTGTLQSVNDLDITATDITNQGNLGAGATFTANANTVTNSGSIVGNDVTITAPQSIINTGPNALIGATNLTGKLALLAPVIQNRDDITATDTAPTTTIYGLGQVILAGSQNGQGQYTAANQILNQSGLIESGGDMQIVADTLTNTRRVLQMSDTFTQSEPTTSGSAVWTPSNPDVPGGRYIEPPHGGEFNSDYLQNNYTETTYTNSVLSISPKAQIISGGNLTPTVGVLQNYWSQIAAVGNISLDNVSLDQDSWRGATPYLSRTVYTGNYLYRTYKGVLWTMDWPSAETTDTPIAGFESSLTSLGNITGSNVSINNTAGTSTYTPLGMPSISNPGAINGISPVTTAPNSALYHQNPDPNAGYLIETDSRFTNYRNWLGSDYMLSQLSFDPSITLKRIGDGFYEQKLVRDQIAQLTGRQFLDGYSSNEAEYQALMDNGIAYAQAYNLIPGVALTAAQMATLTTDLVWLVEKTVTLPDGSTTQAWVPQVYLSTQSTALTSTGSLIAAKNITLANTQAFNNSGTIIASDALSISGVAINNRGGNLQSGGAMALNTTGNMDFTSANVKAGTLQLETGQDLILDTGTKAIITSGANGTRTNTLVGRTGTIDVAGDTQIVTGGNLQQNGGALKVGGDLSTNIQGDWQLGTAKNEETTAVNRMGGHSNTDVVTNITSSVQVGGQSNISVGNDLVSNGAQFDLKGGGQIRTGGDLTLNAVKDTVTVDSSSAGSGGGGHKYSETRNTLDQTVVGTTLNSGQNLTLVSGKDINVTGSSITLDQGAATLIAKGDVNLQAETEQHTLDSTHIGKHSSLVGSKTTNEIRHVDTQTAIGSTLSADTVTVLAGYAPDQSGQLQSVAGQGDINVKGSNVVSTSGTNLMANNNVNITTAQNTDNESYYKDTKKSGLMSSGGLSLTVGKQQLTNTQTIQSVTNTASTVGSINGDVNITSGKAYTQTGSDVVAPAGNINITAQSVDINAAQNTSTSTQQTKFRQSGLTLSISNPVVSAVQTAEQMTTAASKTNDPRMQALAAGTTALAAKNAYDALGSNIDANGNVPTAGNTGPNDLEHVAPASIADKVGGVTISLSLGTSKSQSDSSQTSSTAQGSNVTAGKDINITATGAGAASNLNVIGSTIQAADNVTLKADNQVNLLAAQNINTQTSTNSSSSASVGLSYNTMTGLAVTASASQGKGNANGTDVSYTNTKVIAGNQSGDKATIQSGTDTNLIGAEVQGNQVIANVGTSGLGNLNIQSLQDISTYNSKQNSAGIGVSIPISGTGFGVSGNISNSKMNGDYASVNEQSGIKAGDAGFQIITNGNTNLTGAVIASSEQAIINNKNSLTTQTLTVSDLQNRADYSASQTSLGGGYSTGNGNVGKDPQGHADTGGTQVPGTTLPSLNGFSATTPVALSASDSKSSTTLSGISAASLNITDSDKQVAISGKDAANTIATLNQDVRVVNVTDSNGNTTATTVDSQGNNTAHSLAPSLTDAKKAEINADFAIVQAFTNETSTFIANRAKEADQKTQAAKNADQQANDFTNGLTDEQRLALRDQAISLRNEADAINNDWGAGGTYRQITTALIAAASGNVTGGNADFINNMVVNYVQQQGAAYIGKLVEDGTLTEGSPLHAALHAIVACGGAAASGQDCGAGAAGAAASSLLTGLFSDTTPDETNEQREAKRNLILSLVTGIATATGTDATTANTAATAAVDNNWLATQQIVQMKKDYANASSALDKAIVLAKWATISGKQDVLTKVGIGKGLADAGWTDVKGLTQFLLHPVDGLNGIKQILTDENARHEITDEAFAALSIKIDRIQTALNVGGDANAVQLGEDLGSLLWQVGSVVSGAGGIAKAGTTLAKVGVDVGTQGLQALASLAKFDKYVAAGVFTTDGKPMMDFSALTSAQKGVIGEILGPETVKSALPSGAEKIGRSVSVGQTGIDDLYQVGDKYVVVEYKFGTSELKTTSNGELQMSDDWLLGTKSGYDRILESVNGNEQLATQVTSALDKGNVEKWVVHTDPAGGTSVWIVSGSGKIVKADSTITSKVLGSL